MDVVKEKQLVEELMTSGAWVSRTVRQRAGLKDGCFSHAEPRLVGGYGFCSFLHYVSVLSKLHIELGR